jgi:HSP90 family molecular chaperone
MKTDYEDVWDWRVENDNKPLWTRSPREVAEADYNEFFKQVSRAGLSGLHVTLTPFLLMYHAVLHTCVCEVHEGVRC